MAPRGFFVGLEASHTFLFRLHLAESAFFAPLRVTSASFLKKLFAHSFSGSNKKSEGFVGIRSIKIHHSRGPGGLRLKAHVGAVRVTSPSPKRSPMTTRNPTDRVQAVFQDARALQADALEMLAWARFATPRRRLGGPPTPWSWQDPPGEEPERA